MCIELYAKIYTLLMKEITCDLNRDTVFIDWKTHYIKMSILPKFIYKFNSITI